jgi:hypothetical protein
MAAEAIPSGSRRDHDAYPVQAWTWLAFVLANLRPHLIQPMAKEAPPRTNKGRTKPEQSLNKAWIR